MKRGIKRFKNITALYFALTGIYPFFFLWLEGKKTLLFLLFLIVEIAAILLYSVKKRGRVVFIAIPLLSYALFFLSLSIIWAHTATPKYIAPLWIAEYSLAILLITLLIRSAQ